MILLAVLMEVHATGFIGGNKTFEGAMKMASTSIEADSE